MTMAEVCRKNGEKLLIIDSAEIQQAVVTGEPYALGSGHGSGNSWVYVSIGGVPCKNYDKAKANWFRPKSDFSCLGSCRLLLSLFEQ